MGNVLASLIVATAVIAAFLGGGELRAATCGGGIGNTDNFTTSTACANPPLGPGGNAREQEMNAGAGVFGIMSWMDLGKIETDGALTGTNFSITKNAGDTMGTWSLTSGFSFDPNESYAFVLKGGSSGTIAYLMDVAFSSGTWTNGDIPVNTGNGNGRGNGQRAAATPPGLSNITLFGTGALIPNDPPLNPIPLPAAAWMLLAGLGGLVAMARRRAA